MEQTEKPTVEEIKLTEAPAFIGQLEKALEQLEKDKPNDRSEVDRMYAIAKTDLEKLIAFCNYYLW